MSSTSVSQGELRAERFTATGGNRDAGGVPPRICRHGANHPAADRHDQPTLSASGMNSIGGTRPRVGCAQRSKYFLSDQFLAAVDVHRLEQQQLAARERQLQGRLELELVRRQLGQLGGMELHVVRFFSARRRRRHA